MKLFPLALVILSLTTLSFGCSQGNTFDDPASGVAPPLPPNSSPGNMSAAEKKMVETMSPGGIADPNQGG